MSRCPACSRQLPDAIRAAFCPGCGTALTDDLSTAATRLPERESALDAAATHACAFDEDPSGSARFAPGRVFASRYRIVSLLGQGGMGEVYRADDLRLGQSVAVKLLGRRSSMRDHPGRALVAEVRLGREIAHPNVCRVYDIGSAEGWHYLSMEFVDGETLSSLLRRIGR